MHHQTNVRPTQRENPQQTPLAQTPSPLALTRQVQHPEVVGAYGGLQIDAAARLTLPRDRHEHRAAVRRVLYGDRVARGHGHGRIATGSAPAAPAAAAPAPAAPAAAARRSRRVVVAGARNNAPGCSAAAAAAITATAAARRSRRPPVAGARAIPGCQVAVATAATTTTTTSSSVPHGCITDDSIGRPHARAGRHGRAAAAAAGGATTMTLRRHAYA